MRGRLPLLLLLALPLTGGCSPSPERLADRFIDLYFLESDQARARQLATGLAGKKLDDELQLVEKIRDSYQASEARPSVNYERRSIRVDGAHAFVTYDLTIGGRDHRQVMLSLAREPADHRWRVANFVFNDASPRPSPPPPSPGR